MIALLLMLQVAQNDDALLAKANAVLGVAQRCVVDSASTDVTVCGLRRADRYRVPFIIHDPGDPRYEGVPAERERLLARTTPLQEHSPFLVGGGMAGVHATVNATGAHVGTLRPLAP